VLSSLAAAQVGALVGGPTGVVAAELITSVAKDAIESFTEKKVNPNFKYAKGDWIIVDMGHNHALSKKVLLEETRLTGAMFGDFDLDLAKDLHKKGEDFSVGFFMSESTVPGESNVFVFEVKDTQSVPNSKLAPMTAAMKKKYDTNFSYAAVREMILEKEQLPSLLENVRVENRLEVGSEVVYESKVQHIVSGDSFHSIIEDMDGKRKLVKNSEVTPGRSTTLGIYNYSANDRREFFEPETLATGMFVWVPADKENNLTIQCERVLCVVGYFFGNTAELFEAFNGRERSVHKDKLEMLSDEFSDFINRIKECARFREEAAHNDTNISSFALGTTHLHMCHGLVEGFGRRIYKERQIVMEPKPVVEEIHATPAGVFDEGVDSDEEATEDQKAVGNNVYIGAGVIVALILVTTLYKS
jgi:hypothetical protein